MRDAKAIAKLFDERIGTLADPLDPGFGYDYVRLDVEAAEPLACVSPDFIGTCESRESTATLVDRLSTRLGPARVMRLTAVDTHIPELAQLPMPAVTPKQTTLFVAPERSEPPLRPCHLFDPPQRVEVTIFEGMPVEFRWHQLVHLIIYVEGPERIAAQWWTRQFGERPNKGGLTRDYFRMENTHGQRYWLLRHGLNGVDKIEPSWFIHGIFS